MPKASSKAITSSTVSRESAPKSSTNDAVGVTSPSSTPSCSTIICFTRSSTLAMLFIPPLSATASAPLNPSKPTHSMRRKVKGQPSRGGCFSPPAVRPLRCPLSRSQQYRRITSNHQRMFKMRRKRTIASLNRPTIPRSKFLTRPHSNQGLDGNHQSLSQALIHFRIKKIRHSRRLMNRPPNPMTAKFPHHRKSTTPHLVFNSPPNLIHPTPGPSHPNRLPKSPLRATHQSPRII